MTVDPVTVDAVPPDHADPEVAAGAVARDYAASGFQRRLGFGASPALVVVDFVNAYLTPGSPLHAGVDDVLVAATTLLDGARAADIPVVHTRVVLSPADLSTPFVRKVAGLSLFVGETEAGRIADPLTPREGETVLDKRGASAFHGTDLDALLRAADVDTVLIAGLSTSGCVRATAVDAVQLGYTPVVVREAVGDRAPGPHEAALFDLDAKYADVVGLREVLDHLAGHVLPAHPIAHAQENRP